MPKDPPKSLEDQLKRLGQQFRLMPKEDRLPLYREIGGLVDRQETSYSEGDMQRLSAICGWESTANLYQAKHLFERITEKTLTRMQAARSRNGKPTFTWTSVKPLLTIKDPDERERLIERAIEQRLSGVELTKAANECKKRPSRGTHKKLADPAKAFEACERSLLKALDQLPQIAEGIEELPNISSAKWKHAMNKLLSLLAALVDLQKGLSENRKKIKRTLR